MLKYQIWNYMRVISLRRRQSRMRLGLGRPKAAPLLEIATKLVDACVVAYRHSFVAGCRVGCRRPLCVGLVLGLAVVAV